MRREDRERLRAENQQHGREEEGTQPERPAPGEDRVKGGPTPDEPRKTPAPRRESGRLPIPD
jgi:hypothetical protein